MIGDMKLKIITRSDKNCDTYIEEFTYDHKKAILGEKSHEPFCVCRNNPNEYLKSVLNLFGDEYVDYTFVKDHVTHSGDDIIDLEDTDSVVITYTFYEGNKYVKKLLIKDQDKVMILRDNDKILKVMKRVE